MDSLSLHREFVKELSYDVGVGLQCLSIEFPNLKRLEIYSNFGTQLWRIPCGLDSLQELKVKGLKFTAEDTTAFWNLCSQLKSLRADIPTVTHLPEKSVPFDQLVSLSLRLDNRRSRAQHAEWMEWISQCRNIAVLDLSSRCRLSLERHDFVMRFGTGTWPKLQELTLQVVGLSDMDLAKVIEGIHKATVLNIAFITFGELSLAALRRHYPYLKYLQVRSCHYLPGSRMVAEVMTSCPQLEHLSAAHIRYQDIVNSPPWVCRRSLRFLDITPVLQLGQDLDDHQRRVLGMISQLVNLETLYLCGVFHHDELNLHLGLANGLEQLSTLQKLQTLVLCHAPHNPKQMTEADMKWMVSNWKSLKRVSGLLNKVNNEALAAVLHEAGVIYNPRLDYFWQQRYRRHN
ncbi:hypothetical protein BGX31_006297 [Mortierella sp. GBA43]|nr:hypothetical protein BGX31_006297 [Mortierella sp. GBA43]